MTNTPHPSARYDDRAQRYADAFQDETLPGFPVDRNMIRMLVDLVGERPRVLDAGCGAGQVTKMLRNWACDAVGVDAAEKLIELARTAYPGLAFTVGDLRALPYPDKDFDALVARYSVIHTAPDEVPTVVAEFARVLRPGGCLLVEFQSSGAAPTHALDHAAAPAWAWNSDEFGALLGRAGLVERARLLCPAQPDLKYAGTPRGAPHLPQIGTLTRARASRGVTTSPPVFASPKSIRHPARDHRRDRLLSRRHLADVPWQRGNRAEIGSSGD